MGILHLRGKLLVCCILAQLFLSFQPGILQAEDIIKEYSVPTAVEPNSAATDGEEGLASYYAKRYQNRRTNSGQRYDAAKLTAAHPTLPHGTRVRVINLVNRKEVIVTINDRCRPHAGPFIDLSRAAAKQLGFLGKGKTRVRIIPLEAEEES